jgi:hypothetical protein
MSNFIILNTFFARINLTSYRDLWYSVWLRTGRPGFDPLQRQRIFPLTPAPRTALGPTQPPVQWVPGALSPGVKGGRGVMLTAHPFLVPRLRESRSYTSCHPNAPLWSVTGPLNLFLPRHLVRLFGSAMGSSKGTCIYTRRRTYIHDPTEINSNAPFLSSMNRCRTMRTLIASLNTYSCVDLVTYWGYKLVRLRRS